MFWNGFAPRENWFDVFWQLWQASNETINISQLPTWEGDLEKIRGEEEGLFKIHKQKINKKHKEASTRGGGCQLYSAKGIADTCPRIYAFILAGNF